MNARARRSSPAGEEGNAGVTTGTSLDIVSVIKALQANTGEIELERLLKHMMCIALENAGAQRGALILERDGEWLIEAQGDVDNEITVLQALDLRGSGVVSADIVDAVALSHTSIVLDDAAHEGDFTRDPYITRRGVKSVMCVPLIKQGRLSGMVYLENNLTTNAFTAERLELLSLLSTQMALSLENARLYQQAQQEIAERKEAEAALRESRAMLEQILDTIPQAIFWKDKDSNYIGCNRVFATAVGFSTPEDIIDKTDFDLPWPRHEAEAYRADDKRVITSQSLRRHIIEPLQQADGVRLWVDTTKLPLVDGHGDVHGVLGVYEDITERKQAEEALQQANLVVENSPVVLFRWKPEAGWPVELVSKNVKQFGYLPEELLSGAAPYYSIVHPEDRQRVEREVQEYTQRSIDQFQQEYRIITKTGNVRWVDDHTVVERDADGQISCYQGIVIDITERKQIEDALHRAHEELEDRVQERTAQLEAANKELESFSYSVSHDLRAPLRSMDGFSRILLDEYLPQLPPDAQRYLRLVQDSAKKMGSLVDDLLAFSRLGRQSLNKQPVAMKNLVEQTIKSVADLHKNRRINIKVGILPESKGDPTMLRQAWVNLLLNAYKFTRNREIARIEIGSMETNGESVYFVRDNGAGFEMQYADKLFGVFQRLHSEKEFEGTGVGLAIVQRIIERHGGRVWAEGQVDEGATFYFTLPDSEELDDV